MIYGYDKMKPINVNGVIKAYRALKEAGDRCTRLKTAKAREDILSNAKEAYNDAVERFTAEAHDLTVAIVTAEGRARERVIDAHIVAKALCEVEATLDIPKKYMNGIEVDVDWNSQYFAKAYKFTPMSTHFHAVFKGGTWRVTGIKRGACGHTRTTITHTPESKVALIKRFSTIG